MVSYLDENHEVKIIENQFFELYAYQELVKDTYNTNKLLHFEDILKHHGFEVSSTGGVVKLNQEMKDEMKHLVEMQVEELYNEFVEADDKTLDKFENLNKRVALLGLTKATKEELAPYAEIITNQFKLMEHLNIIRMLKDDKYIDAKLARVYENCFDVKTIECIFNKIKLLRSVEEKYGLEVLEVGCCKSGDIEMDDALFKLFKHLFPRSAKKKPTNYKELMQFFIYIIKNITCNEIISSCQCKTRVDGIRDRMAYSLDKDVVMFHLTLNKYINKNCCGFHDNFVDMFGICVKHQAEAEFLDDEF